MVSPSSCQPVDSASEDKLELISGVWAFRLGKYGFAELYCPINISGNAADWTMFQLWFRDEYGEENRSDHGYISADLMQRHRAEWGATRINLLASSFNFARYPNGNGYGFVSDSSLPIGPEFGRNYYLHVKMWRETNTSLKIVFTGYEIRF